MAVDATDRIVSFLEKPKDPPGMPDKPDKALASMGIYVFATKFLFDQLRRDAADPNSSRDFGKDLIPYLVKHGKAMAHRFTESCVRSGFEADAYWRDVGTLDAYWQANIDLTDVVPALDLYDSEWPIWTYGEVTPPAKFVHDEDGRRGQAVSSLVSGGCIISGASLRHSLLFTGVRVHSFASIENSVVMPVCRHRPLRAAAQRHRRSRRADSGRPGGRRGPAGRCGALPSHRAGRLPDHPADARPIEVMAPLNVLAVVSEIFPLIKTGGLADVAGALPGALAAEGVAVRSLVPGYPPVLDALEGGVAVATLDDLFGGAARIVAAQAAGWTCSSSTRRISMRATAIRIAGPMAGIGPTMRSASPRCRASRRCWHRGWSTGYRPDVVHAHDWQAGLDAGLSALCRRDRAADRDDGPQPRLPGAVSGRICWHVSACPRTPSPSTASSTTARSAI